MKKDKYNSRLTELQADLVQLQLWSKREGKKIAIIFEGRDASGKGGTIQKMTKRLNPNHYRVVAKGKPTAEEEQQWYFQRWSKELPRSGEIVFFDRSWYTRAGVESVMGFATKKEVTKFLKDAPSFERMLVREGFIIIKYWLSITQETQETRFLNRLNDISKQWKLSPMDLASRELWSEYTKAKERMFKKTDTSHCPWYTVDFNDKNKGRIAIIEHLISLFDFERVKYSPKKLPPIEVK